MGSVIGGAGALVGGISGAINSGGSKQTQSNAPWITQQPEIENAYNEATNALTLEQAVPQPSQFVAGENAQQNNATNSLYQAGMAGPNVYGQWQTAGSNLANTQGLFTGNAANISQNGIGAMSPATNTMLNYAQTGSLPGESSVNGSLGQAVTQGGEQGLSALGAAGSTTGQVAQDALNTNGALNAGLQGAAAYSQNPTLNAAIQAANYQTNLGLTENTLPQIRAAAEAGGNANSSREGALEGIATQSASANMANTAAQMESAAYNNGANLGESGYLQSLNTALGAGNAQTALGTSAGNLTNTQQGLEQQAQQFGVSSQLQAANNAATQGLGYQTANTAAQLSANNQLGNGLQIGLNDTNAAYQGTLNGLSAAQAAGTYQENQAQLGINNNLAQTQYEQTEPSNLVNQYYNIVGTKQGGLTNSTSTPQNGGTGGAIAGALGGYKVANGLYSNSGGGSGRYNWGGNTAGGPSGGYGNNNGNNSGGLSSLLSSLFGGGGGGWGSNTN